MRALIFLLLGIIIISCRNSGGKEQQHEEPATPVPDPVESSTKYTSQKWHFSAEIPASFEVFEGQLPGEAPVINFYDQNIPKDPPFAIHNDASFLYIAVLPEGFGVDAPGGPRTTLQTYNENFVLSFDLDLQNSYAYLLENGEAWAMSLRFHSPPPGWNEYGNIFVFYEVQDFRAECFSSNTGKKIPLAQCDALGGDVMKFYGEISEAKKQALNDILESLYFTDPNREREEISQLIKVEAPKADEVVNSPIKIAGKAKGFWFFEATAPVRLISEDGKELAQGYIEAQEDWMTEDWVPFEANLDFETKEKRGYLIFNRANASGKPENDRILRVPVKFN
ncbi:Gmad2 immunoglobulin-like domain-containing protein [Salinimicrobium oceani]|uniref:Bacterial spore germination immunoglobulin-like domain-containing protein n=1 Tax=Salinimicrobium oceani TaxID=2722702 RepID=A0ABX1D0W3_9FLAO|nr:Gmad2 immunoglobulin-like domain-containing protein [Salinimicrobium oceani]NJW53707.1 hypothetical protein [Salinimicrobium oceani]